MYNDETILREQYAYQDALAKYNRTLPSEHETRARMLLPLMAEVGDSCTIDTPVHANWDCVTFILAETSTVTQWCPLSMMQTFISETTA
ncbi:MAG: hypothetical protein ACLS3C_03750 [Oscillospiraceae bacterium]